MATLAINTDWDEIDFDRSGLQDLVVRDPKEAGRRFTQFLKNGGRMIIGKPKIIPIDRTQSFDLVGFLGKGWSIEEEDERSLALVKIDLTKINLKTMLRHRESSIEGEEKLKRLKETDYIRLDAKVFQTFWENLEFIPEKWKKPGAVYFDGTIFRATDGGRCVFCLRWDGLIWNWDWRWLGDGWDAIEPSALLMSP